MAILAPLLPVLGTIASRVADSFFPSPEEKHKREELINSINIELIRSQAEFDKAASQVILAEAQGESWLQRNWRPITMLTFVGLIVAKWLGFAAPGVSEQVELAILDICQVGIGGYAIGRSAEKISKNLPWRKIL